MSLREEFIKGCKEIGGEVGKGKTIKVQANTKERNERPYKKCSINDKELRLYEDGTSALLIIDKDSESVGSVIDETEDVGFREGFSNDLLEMLGKDSKIWLSSKNVPRRKFMGLPSRQIMKK